MSKSIIILLFVLVALFSFFVSFTKEIMPFLFILYLITSLIAISKSKYEVFTFINLVSVQFTAYFTLYEIIYSQSALILFLIIIIIKEKIINRISLVVFIIILYSIIISYGRVSLSTFITGISIIGFLFVIVVYSKIKISRDFIKLIIIIPIILLPVSIYQLIYKPFSTADFDRLTGTVFQANGFAVLIVQYFLMTLSYYIFKKDKFTLIILVIELFLVIKTESRTAFAALLLSAVLLLVFIYGKFKFSLRSIITVFLLGTILYLFLQTAIFQESRFSQINENEIQSSRVYIWESAYKYFENNLIFGLGLGGYEDVKYLVIYQRSMHNNYLNIIANVGVVGFLLIFSFLLTQFSKCYNFLKKNYTILYREKKYYSFGLLPMFLAISVSSLTGSWSYSLYTSFLTFIVLGQVIKEERESNRASKI